LHIRAPTGTLTRTWLTQNVFWNDKKKIKITAELNVGLISIARACNTLKY